MGILSVIVVKMFEAAANKNIKITIVNEVFEAVENENNVSHNN